MSRYERDPHPDAAAERSAAELVRAMREDRITRLRAGLGAVGGGDTPWVAGGGGGESFRAADVERIRGLWDDLRRVMFPGFFDSDPLWDGELEAHITRLCLRIARVLAEEIRAVLRYGRRPAHHEFQRTVPASLGDHEFVDAAVGEFMRRLPEARRMLTLDVQAAYDGDPAAEHTDEIILCYPGLEAIATHRLAHVLYCLGVPILARVMSEQAHSRTGIDIHPGARIGESFFIDHGSATVIGETSVIGRQVKIYQGVTLGARSFPKDERGRVIRGIKRHPTIGDRVTIYAGAVILGGDTVIGDDCVIAGGVFVTSSVAPGHVVQQTRPEPVLKPTAASAPRAAPRPGTDGRPDLGWLADGAGI
ncbi:MAG TPA: serine O-acetyltransferase [Phycisphaerales bacterium]|nr:serine O-acetyltransferase [Phycisphaerales bacterium]